MTPEDKPRFSEALALLMIGYPNVKATTPMITAYWQDLVPYSWEAVYWALREAPSKSYGRSYDGERYPVAPPAVLVTELAKARQKTLDLRSEAADRRLLPSAQAREEKRQRPSPEGLREKGRELESAVMMRAAQDPEPRDRFARAFFAEMRARGIGQEVDQRPRRKTQQECLARLAAERHAQHHAQEAPRSPVGAASVEVDGETWEDL